jgi:serine/threonine protein kinase
MDYDGWEVIKDDKNPTKEKMLGQGGQGKVYLVREPKWATKRSNTGKRIKGLWGQIGVGGCDPTELAECLSLLSLPESAANLAALKVFEIPPDDPEEQTRAIGRLKSEINALKSIEHPSVLKLLHSDVDRRFIVTQYHQRGPLHKNLDLFRGNTLAALKASKPLLTGVTAIHKQKAIHRDIKPENIFVADSGDLLLGDFGIVFFREGDRLTSTFERVGSRDWMAPWAQENLKLDPSVINATLDVYPLAKVLWSMIAGRNGFQFWEFDNEANNLEKLFPHDVGMEMVNAMILAKCVVRYEKDCFSTVFTLQAEVDRLIEMLSTSGQRLAENLPWTCRLCGRGRYVKTQLTVSGFLEQGSDRAALRAFACNDCGHIELFDASSGQIFRK